VVIIIDVSILPENLWHIIDDMKRTNHTNENLTKNKEKTIFDEKEYCNKINAISVDEDKSKMNEIKQKIKDVLIKYGIKDYVVIDDENDSNKLKIVNKAHAERLGIYHCRHCGMAFENEIQLSTNQRLHYFI
jgi:hypothetical protein